MVLRDSIDPDLIPLDSDAVAGYGDGIYLWSSTGWGRFPASTRRLVIVVRPGDRGDVADVERGDFRPVDAPAFVLEFDRPERRGPSLYNNRATWPQTVAALLAAGLDPTAIDWWIATLDGTTDVWYGQPGVSPPAGLRVVAVQVRDLGPYDESVVLDASWLHPQETTMNARLFHDPATGAIWFYDQGLVLFHVEAPADAQALQAAGVPQVDVSGQFLTDLQAAVARAGAGLRGSVSGSLSVNGQVALT